MYVRSVARSHEVYCLTSVRKFGKHIQKKQLDIPEYAPSFVDYKALKKVDPAISGLSSVLAVLMAM